METKNISWDSIQSNSIKSAMSAFQPDSDSEDELPPGWIEQTDESSNVSYVKWVVCELNQNSTTIQSPFNLFEANKREEYSRHTQELVKPNV